MRANIQLFLEYLLRYDIYFITGKKYAKDYKYNEKIKRVYIHNNYTLIRNFTKYVKIDAVNISIPLSSSISFIIAKSFIGDKDS